jgi:hypothetical protein
MFESISRLVLIKRLCPFSGFECPFYVGEAIADLPSSSALARAKRKSHRVIDKVSDKVIERDRGLGLSHACTEKNAKPGV